jgi:hypothetical protein
LSTPGASAPTLSNKAPLRGLVVARPTRFDARSLTGSLLSALAVLGLVGAITLVVRQAVRQGEAGRRAMAVQAEADWRCRALKARAQRERCVALVQEHQPWDSAGVQALVQQAGSAAPRP